MAAVKRGRDSRLIPAGAGSTAGETAIPALERAHPRWRGEHSTPAPVATCKRGSSPLARGALPTTASHTGASGLIPAGAGSTNQRPWTVSARWAHPRWRGEHRLVTLQKADIMGSSPLARGARFSLAMFYPYFRLIPAGAGSTRPSRRTRVCGRAHPRWRGEHDTPGAQIVAASGSSPLARGAHSLSCGSLSRKADSSSTCFPLDHRSRRSRAAGNPLIVAVPCSNHVAVANPPYYLAA